MFIDPETGRFNIKGGASCLTAVIIYTLAASGICAFFYFLWWAFKRVAA